MALDCDPGVGRATDVVSRVLHVRPAPLVESRSVALEGIQLRTSILDYVRELNEEAEEHGEHPVSVTVAFALVQLAEWATAYASQLGTQMPSPGVFARGDGSGILVFHNTGSRLRLSIEIPPDAALYKMILVDAERASPPILLLPDPRMLQRAFAWVALTPIP